MSNPGMPPHAYPPDWQGFITPRWVILVSGAIVVLAATVVSAAVIGVARLLWGTCWWLLL